MTSTELAQSFVDQDLNGLFLSELQGNRLYSVAERERLVSHIGLREAAGTLADGRTWRLSRVVVSLTYWLFEVLPLEQEEEGA